jgi:hypothetical protein
MAGVKGCTTGIGNMLCQLAVLQQVFYFQCLDNYRLAFVNELSGQIVLEISTGIRKALMRPGEFKTCF